MPVMNPLIFSFKLNPFFARGMKMNLGLPNISPLPVDKRSFVNRGHLRHLAGGKELCFQVLVRTRPVAHRASSTQRQKLPPTSPWMPPMRHFCVKNSFPWHPRGQISSKFQQHGTTVTSLLSSEPQQGPLQQDLDLSPRGGGGSVLLWVFYLNLIFFFSFKYGLHHEFEYHPRTGAMLIFSVSF